MSELDTDLSWSPAPGADHDEVIFAVDGPVGRIRLNRPRAINALTPAITTAMHRVLRDWADDPAIAAVFIDGAGERGLCAGGDVRGLREFILAGVPDDSTEFWDGEYQVNALIAAYPKPYVAWMDGVVMGGGVGVSSHGSLPVVTQRTKLAMPETIIGFFPDVGGLYFLSRAPGELGTYLALNGATVGGVDTLVVGMAQALVDADAKSAVLDLLRAEPTADAQRLVQVAGGVTAASLAGATGDLDGERPDVEGSAPELSESWLLAQREWIDACYQGSDAAAILTRLRERPEPEAQEAATQLAARSPFGVSVTLEALRRSASMDVNEVLAQDLQLSKTFAWHPDFTEGVRALLVDKDQSPQWLHASLTEVPRAEVLKAFG